MVENYISAIDHTILKPGHTQMKCSLDIATIKKYKKKAPFPIYLSRYWFTLVRMTGKAGSAKIPKFQVVEMRMQDFLSFQSYQ